LEEKMVKSNVGHLQINVNPTNVPFYKALFGFLGWKVIYEEDLMVGVGDEHGTSLWFGGPVKDVNNDYDGPGMNHLAIAVADPSGVDESVAYLKKNDIKALFDTPRHRPEFCGTPERDYYQVMFESPDRILFEIVYTGPVVK
jgi:catechol 2,3-dioxygenase-like lactoylglutathione lyase family enzyme